MEYFAKLMEYFPKIVACLLRRHSQGNRSLKNDQNGPMIHGPIIKYFNPNAKFR